MTVVNAVNVREQNERVGFHHLGDKAREFVIIGEHQLGDRYRVIFVDNRQYIILQHDFHAGLLVPVLLARLKVLLHSQHLTDVDAELTEQIIVESYELYLSHGGEELALLNAVEAVVDGQLTPPASDGAGGHENHFETVTAEFGNLVDE